MVSISPRTHTRNVLKRLVELRRWENTQTDRQTHRQTHRHTDTQTDTQTHRHTDRHTDTQTHRQTDRDNQPQIHGDLEAVLKAICLLALADLVGSQLVKVGLVTQMTEFRQQRPFIGITFLRMSVSVCMSVCVSCVSVHVGG